MSTTFPIFPLSRFEQAGQTTIRRPREITYFSFDENREIKFFSNDSLRYYYPPFTEVPGVSIPRVDLTAGFQDWIKSDPSIDHHLDGLLQTIQAYEEAYGKVSADSGESKTKVDIMTWRGMMTKIMTAPFDIFSDFEMNATWFQGTIYIEENHSYKLDEERDHRPTKRGELSPEMMQYCGYKFENLSVLKKSWAETTREDIDSRDKDIVNNNEQYCSIVRTGIGSTSLVLAGEVDCVMGEKPDNPDEPIPWVELKTSAEPPSDHPRERQKFERKMLRFWAQSFLLGVPKIIVGFRSPAGLLTRLQEFETQRIPGIVARGEQTWNGNVCIKFTAAFLEFLTKTLEGQDGVWRIKRSKNSREIEVFKVEDSGIGAILTKAFKTHRESMIAAEIARNLRQTASLPEDQG